MGGKFQRASRITRLAPILVLLASAAGVESATGQSVSDQLEDPAAADVRVVGHVLEPRRIEPTAARIADPALPPGFEISVFAEGLSDPRMIAVAGDGTVYVTRRRVGDVLMLRDADSDGRAETQRSVASRPGMHELAF